MQRLSDVLLVVLLLGLLWVGVLIQSGRMLWPAI